MTEAQITKMMQTLKLSREEAIELIREDEEIDRMTSTKEIDSDLTEEQRKAKKKATNTTGDKTKRSYTFTKRERKPDLIKREIIETIAHNLDRCVFEGEEVDGTVDNVQIANPEREITFAVYGDAYSLVLTKHRKPKGE